MRVPPRLLGVVLIINFLWALETRLLYRIGFLGKHNYNLLNHSKGYIKVLPRQFFCKEIVNFLPKTELGSKVYL
ncbi:hypothetical protein NUACC26_057250 [Scytonema sp. NUACC26]